MNKIWLVALAAFTIALPGCATRGPISLSCPIFNSVVTALPPSPLELDIRSDAGQRAELAEALARDITKAAGPLAPTPPDALLDAFRRAEPLANAPEKSGFRAGSAPRPVQALLLSGGGQWGAFGAGFLDQLQASPEAIDPQIITGVSTGGLQSLFVAVGTAAAYDELVGEYSPAAQSDLVNANPTPLALITGSMAGIAPLRRAIENALCKGGDLAGRCPMIDLLAATPRKVLIGFVEASSGQFLMADVNKIAGHAAAARGTPASTQANKVARDCLTGAALASAGMPLFFQPVRIENKVYYDGGVRQSVFLANVADAARKSMIAADGHKVPPPTLYVIRNGPTQLLGKDGKPGDDLDVDNDYKALTAAMRAQSIIVNQVEVGSIASLRLFHPSGKIYLATADGYHDWTDAAGKKRSCEKGKERFFNPDFMACLQDLGRTKAVRENPWIDVRTIKPAP